jgi:hypothetical protein
MPDGEGYMFAGELPVGAYTAAEMDLGDVLRPLDGFGRTLEDDTELRVPWPGVRTRPFDVTFGEFL